MIYLRIGMIVVIAWLGYYFGAPIVLSAQWPLYDALRNTTSIAFGIMGALIALVYPDAVKNALRGSSPMQAIDGGLGRLITPCGHSAMLLVVLVVLAPFIAWLGAADAKVLFTDLKTIQQISFSVFCVLSYWQVIILLMVVMPFDDMYTRVSHDIQRERLRRGMHTNGPV